MALSDPQLFDKLFICKECTQEINERNYILNSHQRNIQNFSQSQQILPKISYFQGASNFPVIPQTPAIQKSLLISPNNYPENFQKSPSKHFYH